MTDAKPQQTPGRVLAVLVRKWWIILLAAIIGGIAAFGYSSTLTPIYLSSSSIYFSMRSATSGSDINQGSAYTQNQMLSFAQLATSSIVLDEVRAGLSQDVTNAELRNMTSVSIPQNTVILEITAGSSDPAFAAEVANAMATELSEAVAELAPVEEGGNATIVARVIEPAVPATVQASPNKQRDAVLGAFAGALLAGLGIALWALLDTRVRSTDVLRRLTDLPLLGAVPERKGAPRAPVLIQEPNGPSAEAYRGVRASLRFAAVEHSINSLAVTSSIPGEGKTTTAVNLALSYAEAGLRVILVDADLRRPQIAATLGLENAIGLTTMLVGSVTFDEAKLRWGDTSLTVLPAGEIPPNPAELLASARMAEILTEIRGRFDMMVVDTAPLLSVVDAAVIAQHVDSTVVVVDVSKTRLAQLSRALTALRSAGVEVAGIIFTHARRRRSDSYYDYSSEARVTASLRGRGRGKTLTPAGELAPR
ncbi:polysaccharide biosynthesis tyrosine autokinase [Micromonospora sp. DT81.3]|uniref:polysaccharide biosynthesis tyrosine autokinase n=1 Tax=Actinomycetes TaxID=1760 RepID=UPI003CE7279B